MRKVEVGLRVAALQLSTWALFAHGRGKVAQRNLPIVTLLLCGLIIAILSLARIPAEDTHGARPASIRAELANAERDGTHGVTKDAVPTPAVKPDIVLPDIFIPVPAEIIVPAPNQFHAPATKKRNF